MISIKMPNVNKLFDGLDPRSLALVKVRAQNALAAKAKTLANRTAREEFYVKAEVLRKAMYVDKANLDDSTATLVVTGTKTKLGYFRISPSRMNPKQQRRILGTRVTISRTSGKKEWRGTFTAQMRSGHVGVFRRDPTQRMKSDNKRPAIVEQAGIGPADMVGSKIIEVKLRQLVHDESEIIYKRELAYALSTATAVVKL